MTKGEIELKCQDMNTYMNVLRQELWNYLNGIDKSGANTLKFIGRMEKYFCYVYDTFYDIVEEVDPE